MNCSLSYSQNEIVFKGDTGVFISAETLKEINHQLIEGKICEEYSVALEIEYDTLEYHFNIARDIIDEKDLQLDLKEEIYKEQKKKLIWWAVTSSVVAGVLLIFHII